MKSHFFHKHHSVLLFLGCCILSVFIVFQFQVYMRKHIERMEQEHIRDIKKQEFADITNLFFQNTHLINLLKWNQEKYYARIFPPYLNQRQVMTDIESFESLGEIQFNHMVFARSYASDGPHSYTIHPVVLEGFASSDALVLFLESIQKSSQSSRLSLCSLEDIVIHKTSDHRYKFVINLSFYSRN